MQLRRACTQLETRKRHGPHIKNLLKYYSAIVSVFFSVPFPNILAYPNSLLVPPIKGRIESAYIGCIDVDWARVVKGLFQLFVGLVANELKARPGFYLLRKNDDNSHVCRASYGLRIVKYVINL